MELKERIDNYAGITVSEDQYILRLGPTEALYYSNAELSDGEFEDLKWKYGYCELEAKIEYNHFGSFGFGFWNHTMRIKESSPIWFINLNAPGKYPLKGFFIQVRNIFIPIKLYSSILVTRLALSIFPFSKPIKIPTHKPLYQDLDLTEWNKFSIEWRREFIKFNVNGDEIYKLDINVSDMARFDIWIDNAVFIPGKDPASVFRHVTNEVRRANKLYIRGIRLRKI